MSTVSQNSEEEGVVMTSSTRRARSSQWDKVRSVFDRSLRTYVTVDGVHEREKGGVEEKEEEETSVDSKEGSVDEELKERAAPTGTVRRIPLHAVHDGGSRNISRKKAEADGSGGVGLVRHGAYSQAGWQKTYSEIKKRKSSKSNEAKKKLLQYKKKLTETESKECASDDDDPSHSSDDDNDVGLSKSARASIAERKHQQHISNNLMYYKARRKIIGKDKVIFELPALTPWDKVVLYEQKFQYSLRTVPRSPSPDWSAFSDAEEEEVAEQEGEGEQNRSLSYPYGTLPQRPVMLYYGAPMAPVSFPSPSPPQGKKNVKERTATTEGSSGNTSSYSIAVDASPPRTAPLFATEPTLPLTIRGFYPPTDTSLYSGKSHPAPTTPTKSILKPTSLFVLPSQFKGSMMAAQYTELYEVDGEWGTEKPSNKEGNPLNPRPPTTPKDNKDEDGEYDFSTIESINPMTLTTDEMKGHRFGERKESVVGDSLPSVTSNNKSRRNSLNPTVSV